MPTLRHHVGATGGQAVNPWLALLILILIVVAVLILASRLPR